MALCFQRSWSDGDQGEMARTEQGGIVCWSRRIRNSPTAINTPPTVLPTVSVIFRRFIRRTRHEQEVSLPTANMNVDGLVPEDDEESLASWLGAEDMGHTKGHHKKKLL